jgi:NfeD-like C-terminal, partner-binding
VRYLFFVALIAWALKCVKFLRRGEQGGVIRLGGMMGDWSNPLGPGIYWIWWPVDTLYRWNVFTGQQDLIGAEGKAVDDIRSGYEGLVRVRGKLWRATSNQKILHGHNVCVVGSDGLNLRVESGPVESAPEVRAEHSVLVPQDVGTAATIVGLEAVLLVLGSGYWVLGFYAVYLDFSYGISRREILGGAILHAVLAVGLLMIAAALGLQKLRTWARLASLSFAGVVACGLVFGFARAFAPEWAIAAILALVFVIPQLWVFLCLLRPKVGRAFAEAKSLNYDIEYVQQPLPGPRIPLD